MLRKIGCFGFLAAFLLIGVVTANFVYGWNASGPLETETAFIIEEGSSLSAVAEQLEKANAIDSASSFLTRAKILGSGDSIKTGEFMLPAGASNADILALLQSNEVVQRMVTVPEGMPSILVYEALMAEPLLAGSVEVPAEGSILPETYSFERGETRQAVLDRMQSDMKNVLAELWEKRSPDTVVKSPGEAINLASIVEKETALPKERRMVAGVLSNRVRIGMRLGADATTIYPITKGKPLGRRIRVSELRDPNPYNTRAIAGLPAGPITNPGRESIAAVLSPAETKALYYVADGSGGHVFSETLEEHNRNAEKWRALRRERGEM
ncbi:endolytic transglycosylase MltG [Sphingorhabdus sp. Alg239-R122]|uniref:endolytic transglycosylase MltG n=1 Tax=Sphingorhabdus sp. Alg239-R122 TaxID=2305989 RepID=UPI0013D933D3|nr:endolytic transglycosylase MltG [Sphingorhabdus sp. Alg239-R122]